MTTPSLTTTSLPTTSLTRQTHLRLRTDIIQGRIRPNERLVALELAERLHVSRTPVREALQLLASEGLVVPVKRGYAVREHSPGEIREIYQIRSALDELAARLAAHRATESDVREIEAIGAHRRGVLDDDRTVLVDTNDAFHTAILVASGNTRLAEISRSNSEQFFTHRVAKLYTQEQAAAAVDEHARILDAIRANDADAAAEAARCHVLRAMTVTLAAVL